VVFEECLPPSQGGGDGLRTCVTHVVATYCLSREAHSSSDMHGSGPDNVFLEQRTSLEQRQEQTRKKGLLSFFAETTANKSSFPHRGYYKSSRKSLPPRIKQACTRVISVLHPFAWGALWPSSAVASTTTPSACWAAGIVMP
jgi:hypothetical protein